MACVFISVSIIVSGAYKTFGRFHFSACHYSAQFEQIGKNAHFHTRSKRL